MTPPYLSTQQKLRKTRILPGLMDTLFLTGTNGVIFAKLGFFWTSWLFLPHWSCLTATLLNCALPVKVTRDICDTFHKGWSLRHWSLLKWTRQKTPNHGALHWLMAEKEDTRCKAHPRAIFPNWQGKWLTRHFLPLALCDDVIKGASLLL